MSDLISRADAIDALSRSSVYAWSTEQDLVAHSWAIRILQSLPSTDAVPTVIRAKTFMRKEDFDKWAEGIKKQNKSIVCIPCDAEVVSADAVQGEWQIIGYDKDYIPIQYTCSVCGSKFLDEYNFCPDCGARMTPYKGGDM